MRRHILPTAISFAFAAAVAIGFQNCGYIANPIDSKLLAGFATNTSFGYTRAISYGEVYNSVFDGKCKRCHNASLKSGDYDVTSYAQAIRKINFESLESSPLLDSIRSGRMPSGDSMLESQKQVIYDWILSGAANTLPAASAAPLLSGKSPNLTASLSNAQPSQSLSLYATVVDAANVVSRYEWQKVSGPNVTMMNADTRRPTVLFSTAGSYTLQVNIYGKNGQNTSDQVMVTVTGGASSTPTPTPTPTATPTAQATYSWIKTNIISAKCAGCHSDMTSYSGMVAISSRVKPNDAAGSALYIRVNNNSMPSGGTPLTAAEKTAIQTWINNGAQNN